LKRKKVSRLKNLSTSKSREAQKKKRDPFFIRVSSFDNKMSFKFIFPHPINHQPTQLFKNNRLVFNEVSFNKHRIGWEGMLEDFFFTFSEGEKTEKKIQKKRK
jgi:hypothetical protein